MKPGSKYYPLFKYLQRSLQKFLQEKDEETDVVADKEKSQAQENQAVVLTFGQIEKLLQKPLPASARKRAWWSNRDSGGAFQASAWVQAGYQVTSVDIEQQRVVFSPFQAVYNPVREGDRIVWNQTSVKALRKCMGLTQSKFAEEMGVRRQTVSEWENGVYEPDRSTAKHLDLIAKQVALD